MTYAEAKKQVDEKRAAMMQHPGWRIENVRPIGADKVSDWLWSWTQARFCELFEESGGKWDPEEDDVETG